MYSIDKASKVEGHDLKGATHFLSQCLRSGCKIVPPLMVIVEYVGVRILAMTYLPIDGNNTLVHGSSDRGNDVQYDQEAATELEKVNMQACTHIVSKNNNNFFFQTGYKRVQFEATLYSRKDVWDTCGPGGAPCSWKRQFVCLGLFENFPARVQRVYWVEHFVQASQA